MANKRSALSLAKKLRQLDNKLYKLYKSEKPTDKKEEELEAQKIALVKAALSKNVRLISIGVADGYSIYYESHRTSRYMTFEYLYSQDDYISGFGKTVLVPLKTGDNLINQFKRNYRSLL